MKKTFALWTGPVAAQQVGLRLSEANLKDVRVGTERVYFRMNATWEQAAGEELLHEAQRAVNEVYPHAGYTVYEV